MPARSGSTSGGLRRWRSRSPRFAPGFAKRRFEAEPREAAFDDPCQPSDRENTLPALEDSQLPAIAPELAGELAARVASIRDNRADRRPKRCQAGQQPGAGNRLRRVRRLDAIGERKAEHIDQNVAFPSFRPLVTIEAANAPFSLVLTDWPSMMTTVGPGFCPVAARASG